MSKNKKPVKVQILEKIEELCLKKLQSTDQEIEKLAANTQPIVTEALFKQKEKWTKNLNIAISYRKKAEKTFTVFAEGALVEVEITHEQNSAQTRPIVSISKWFILSELSSIIGSIDIDSQKIGITSTYNYMVSMGGAKAGTVFLDIPETERPPQYIKSIKILSIS